MKKIDELQQLRGIGAVLAKRLRNAGLDSFQRIAEAGEGGVGGISGINQHLVAGIVQQAALLSAHPPEEGAKHDEDGLSEKIDAVKGLLQSVAKDARQRFAGKIGGKRGRRLSETVVCICDSLDRIADTGKHRKRSRKGLEKVQHRMETLDQVKLKKFGKGLKKSRRLLAELAR
ncbi:hypothetical protein LPW11_21945 [Geomonas sp. RF6]|uniref:hypothetical protein n=1 Tax=Geomonas sp. RF6 TaxID=2897342 RepID=UPI001E3807BF|nr:hypothetical protein [Geomonas sp. RF6]UFS70518.1 hypothetical protein LPW11_21945 [Geomonas sp. RF6]